MRAAGWLLILGLLGLLGWAWYRYAPHTLPAFVTRDYPRAPENPPLFKWRDAQGQWHITDEPPADRPYETIVVDPNTNVVPSTLPADDGTEPTTEPEAQ